MSTSYKQRERSRISYDQRHGIDTLIYGKVTEVYTGTNNIKREGTISVTATGKRSLPQIAYPLHYGIQQVPVLGEVVALYYSTTLEKLFYGPAINIHNFPTHQSTDPTVQATLDFEEPASVNPYTIFTGDTILQGRFGQSIRMSQSIPDKTPWQGSLGSSAIVLSNGQTPTQDGSELLVEDINEDASSLYLLEDSTLSLVDKYAKEEEYRGHQSILSSDRIHLHARKDDVLIRTQEGSIDIAANDDIKLSANQNISLEDANWKATLTDILSLIEKVFEGGLPVGSAVTLPSPSILTEIALLQKKLK